MITHLKASVSQIETNIYIIRLICQKYDTSLDSVCIPFMMPFDPEPGFSHTLFSQNRPTGQSISLLHWTVMSPTSSRACKLGPMY